MISKFRAWDKESRIIRNVVNVNFETKIITCDWKRNEVESCTEMYDKHLFEGEYELLQSTGLFDLDGNEIYIGDILKMEDEYTQVVFHEDNTTYGIYLEDKEGGGNPISDYSTRISLNHIKGIIEGNKYEHPHLLEE